jgi:hypothetical protein
MVNSRLYWKETWLCGVLCEILLALFLFLLVTGYVAVQDYNPYTVALALIQQAAETGTIELNLAQIGLAAVPSAIGQLTNLQVLELTGNRLTSLPPEIGQLTNLANLSLERNQLTSLPPEIGQLTKLERLSLYNNQLRYLPTEMSNLTNLIGIAHSDELSV